MTIKELLDSVGIVVDKQARERGITIITDGYPVEHRCLLGSPLHLRRLLMNIISNAVKYNRVGGEIRLGCCEKTSADPETAQIEFTCADTGIGMSGDFVKNQLFEPFTQEQYGARTRYQGTGLGMSIVKGLVEKMGGTIQVESVRGEGTTFTFRLPFTVSETAASETNTVGEDISDLLRDRRILLVEDNEINMEIAQFYLEEAGAKVIVLCDTNGGTLPQEIYDITKAVRNEISIEIGIHSHDDMGMAVANSIMAVEAGAKQVQGTFIGIGERCGNANLSAIIPVMIKRELQQDKL